MLTEFAPAKINLTLHITGKTNHNYHLLESLVVFASIGDCVTVESGEELHLSIAGKNTALKADSGNSVLRAAMLLRESFSIRQGAKLVLHKNLPIGAGIGGGSADAAATLRVLVKLWQIENPALEALALSIGADVPVCIRSQTAIMRGIGEIIDYTILVPETYVVLVNNNKTLLTQNVFDGFNGQFSQSSSRTTRFADLSHFMAYLQQTSNDLQPSAMRLMPDIHTMQDALSQSKDCVFARMSGSGATCFGLYATLKQAQEASASIQGAYPKWWVRAGKIL